MVLELASIGVVVGFMNPYLAPLVDDLVSYTFQKIFLSSDKEQLKIGKTLVIIQAIVNSMERRPIQDEAVLIWLKQLKEAVYDATDVLDEAEAERLSQQGPKIGLSRNIIDFKPRPILTAKIKAVWERLEFIAEAAGNFALLERVNKIEAEQSILTRTQTSSFIIESSITGREEDQNKIINMLLEPSDRPTFVLPIVGIGGVGKTALAQLVYNNTRVRNEFQVRIWIHVSHVFDSRRLVLEMLESITENVPPQLMNWNTLQEMLIRRLHGQKFLVILDDLWNENEDTWESFLGLLRNKGNGSKILVTTRYSSVAKMSGMMEPYFLDDLSEEHVWSLFKEVTNLDEHNFEQQKLILLGKKIIEKLHGSPLAIRTVGRILRSKPTEAFWRTIVNRELWEIKQEEQDILPTIELSYQMLPPYLKQCFAFHAIFPRGYKNKRSKLVQMWMGQGYICHHEKQIIEDIGNDYINELLNKLLLLQSKGDRIVMHDFMYNIAQRISVDDCCNIKDGKSENLLPQNLRHLSVTCKEFDLPTFLTRKGLEHLRTLLVLSKFDFMSKDLHKLFSRIKYIRVLDVSGLNIEMLPENISSLKLLRYFDASNNNIKQLPAKLYKLCHLQTLKLYKNDLKSFPLKMWKLTNLRCIGVDKGLISKIYYLGRLTNLQELKEFHVSTIEGHTIAELKGLTQIRGSLLVEQLEFVESEKKHGSVLNNKEDLSELTLKWSSSINICKENVECLEPHPNLKVLRIQGYNGACYPEWLENAKEMLPNLEQLFFEECFAWEFLPSLGDLCFLTSLDFTGMKAIQRLCHCFCGSSGFPMLKKLHFSDMPEWDEWLVPEIEHIFPSLTELFIKNCIKLKTLPLLPPALVYLTLEAVGLTSFLGVNQAAECPLNTLIIRKCNDLASFTEGCFEMLPCLENLVIEECPSLVGLPQAGVPGSLEELTISGCHRLAEECKKDKDKIAHVKKVSIDGDLSVDA